MYELLILALLVIVIVLALRPAGPAAPLIVHSPGRYHLTLAPQLRNQQAFLERIADLYLLSHVPQGDLPGKYFRVSAEETGRAAAYLLAIAQRKGTLYFQAIGTPHGCDQAGQLEAIREFSGAVLAQLPLADVVDASGKDALHGAVALAARQSGKSVGILV
jgi:hypothetical protein